MELLPDDVIEHILERLDVKSLLKFKSVSKQWKSIIQSPYFQGRQLIHHRRQSRDDPYVLLVSVVIGSDAYPKIEALRSLVVGSSVSTKIPTPWENKFYEVCNTSCDGLICLYYVHDVPSIVVNPTTRWHRAFPPCNFQLVPAESLNHSEVQYPSPGFGKDKINGTYKQVWLYNFIKLGLNNNVTTCEVFDFTTNAWRYIVPASTYLILHTQDPVYLDGSLHWFTEGETKVLSLDLLTETFQVICKAPFYNVVSHFEINMCNLDDRLCVSQMNFPNQVIWSLDSDQNIWKQIYSIDLIKTSFWFGSHRFALTPLAVLDEDKLLFYDVEFGNALVTHDPKTKSYDLAYSLKDESAYTLSYFPSLISIL